MNPAGGSPPPGPCPECGAEDWEVQAAGSRDRVLWWLRSGRPVPRARLTCRRCGSQHLAHGGRFASYGPLSRPSWWGAPARVLRVLDGARTAIPSPLVYLGAAIVGTALGAALDLALGWPWWAVALGAVAAVWLLFLLTAFPGARRRTPGWLGDQLLEALSPGRAVDRWERRMERAFRDPPFPLYGLPPSWQGPRFLGGMGWGGTGRRAGPSELELAHGDPGGPGGVELRVSTSAVREEPGVPEDLRLRELAESLWHDAHRPPPDLPPDRFPEWVGAREREHRRAVTPAFSPVEVPVDGEPVRFAYLREGSAWVAVGRRGEVTITLRGRNVDAGRVELVTVRDVEPYVEGSRRLRDRWRSPEGTGEGGPAAG